MRIQAFADWSAYCLWGIKTFCFFFLVLFLYFSQFDDLPENFLYSMCCYRYFFLSLSLSFSLTQHSTNWRCLLICLIQLTTQKKKKRKYNIEKKSTESHINLLVCVCMLCLIYIQYICFPCGLLSEFLSLSVSLTFSLNHSISCPLFFESFSLSRCC